MRPSIYKRRFLYSDKVLFTHFFTKPDFKSTFILQKISKTCLSIHYFFTKSNRSRSDIAVRSMCYSPASLATFSFAMSSRISFLLLKILNPKKSTFWFSNRSYKKQDCINQNNPQLATFTWKYKENPITCEKERKTVKMSMSSEKLKTMANDH